jgi:hypothetical protein
MELLNGKFFTLVNFKHSDLLNLEVYAKFESLDKNSFKLIANFFTSGLHYKLIKEFEKLNFKDCKLTLINADKKLCHINELNWISTTKTLFRVNPYATSVIANYTFNYDPQKVYLE